MSVETQKSNEEMLAEVYRNCQNALESISDILPETEDSAVRNEILRQHETYEAISSKACAIAKEQNVELKDPNPMKKAMMWTGIKMNTFADNTPTHIAEMMLSGTVTGIKCLRSSYSESKAGLTEEVDNLVMELLSAEESFETAYKHLL